VRNEGTSLRARRSALENEIDAAACTSQRRAGVLVRSIYILPNPTRDGERATRLRPNSFCFLLMGTRE